ncbi:MAG: hypothetical protein PHH28_08110 [Desulfuromonadaceae bacterium]|nr:hypothetical protein [Desulfuromonadaceae bacterium]
MQKGIFSVLLVIAFLLGASLFRSNEVHAAKKYNYVVMEPGYDKNNVMVVLNDMSNKGWEFVSMIGEGKILLRK